MGETMPQNASRSSYRRVLLGSLVAVCLIFGAIVAIAFAGEGQSKEKLLPTATVDGTMSSMAHFPAHVMDPGEKTKGGEGNRGMVHILCAELIPWFDNSECLY